MKSKNHPTPSPGSSTVAPLMTPKSPPANPAAVSLARAAQYDLTLTDRAICSADDKLARMKDFACAAKASKLMPPSSPLSQYFYYYALRIATPSCSFTFVHHVSV